MSTPSPSTIKLSLTADYAPFWTPQDGLREFVQNWWDGVNDAADSTGVAIDTQQAFNNHTYTAYRDVNVSTSRTPLGSISVDHGEFSITLLNHHVSLARKVLLIGASSKRNDAKSVGQFGEGFKVGALALIRNGARISMETNRELWTFCLLADDEFGGERVLSIEISPLDTTSLNPDDTRTVIQLPDLDWAKLAPNFLFLTPPDECVRTSHGTLLLGDSYAGKLYVKQFFVADVDDLATGVDLPTLDIDRDRRAIVKAGDLATAVSAAWAEAVRTHPNLLPRYADLLNQGRVTADVAQARWHLSDSTLSLLATNFIDQNGPSAFPVHNASTTELAELTTLGFEPVPVSETLASLITAHFNATKKTTASVDLVLRHIDIADLSNTQVSRLAAALSITQTHLPDLKLDSLSLVQFASEHLHIDSGPSPASLCLSIHLLDNNWVHNALLHDTCLSANRSHCHCSEVLTADTILRHLALTMSSFSENLGRDERTHLCLLATASDLLHDKQSLSKQLTEANQAQADLDRLLRSTTTSSSTSSSSSSIPEPTLDQSALIAELHSQIDTLKQQLLDAQLQASTTTTTTSSPSPFTTSLKTLSEENQALRTTLSNLQNPTDLHTLSLKELKSLENTHLAGLMAVSKAKDKLIETLNASLDEVLCPVCLDNKIDTLLQPCRHTICQRCASSLVSCPQCRQPIDNTIVSF